MLLEAVQLGFEIAGIGDLVQVGELALEVSEERLDPGLVVRGGGASEVLRDPRAGEEHRGGFRGHLRAVVADGQQHRDAVVGIGHGPGGELVQQRLVQQVLLAVGDQRPGEGDLDLGGGLLGGDHGGQPFPGHHVQDRDRGAAGRAEVREIVDPDRPGTSSAPSGTGA